MSFSVNNSLVSKSALNKPTISLGDGSQVTLQGDLSVSLGYQAGQIAQRSNSIALGVRSATSNQQPFAVAVGFQAGHATQGTYSVAIGFNAGLTSQSSNSIVLNASASTVNSSTPGFFVNPLRVVGGDTTFRVVNYNTTTFELSYGTTPSNKTFVIQHPTEQDKYLVHGCLEGPEVGVYYRGESSIVEGENEVVVELPSYASKISGDFSVQVTPIFDGKVKHYEVSKVVDNKFKVHGDSGSFFWHVHGKRGDLEVEPEKSKVNLQSVGPYTWLN